MNISQQPLPKANIMIVDDTLDNLRLLSKVLTNQGYKVRGVSNGPRALRAAQLYPPDLVLLDIRMPEMDGYQVCKALKADERIKDIPVIFLSALDEAVDKVKGFESGGVDYITKPFQAKEVLARVETHLALREMQKRLEEQNIQLQQEIAERKQAEDELRESETRAKALLHAIPDLMFRLNREGLFFDYKAAKPDLYIQSEDPIIGKTCNELLPAELAELTQSYIAKTLDSGEVQIFEYQLPIPGREVHDYEARMVVSGKNEVTAIVRDITERNQAEEALREREASLKEAQRLARIGSWDLDLLSGKVIWSEELYHILHVKPGTDLHLNTLMSELMHPDDKAMADHAIQEALTTGELQPFEFRVIRSDGEERVLWCEVGSSIIKMVNLSG